MKFSYTLAAVFATAAVAAPVAQIPEVPVDAGLLAKLSPDVAALVTGLGLTSLAPGLASTLVTLSEGLKTRQVDAEVPVDAGLLAKLSPDVAALVTGLGLTSLAPGLASTLITLSGGLKARQLPVGEVTNLPVVGEVANTVTGLVAGAGVVGREADVAVDAGLLAKLSPDVAALVTGLGLTSLAPGLASTLITLSQGLKTRQSPDVAAELKPAVEAIIKQATGAVEEKVVPTVQGTVEKVVPTVKGAVEKVTGALGGIGARDVADVPVDAGLLAKLSPDVAALVTGLGLTSLAPGLASTLITLSEGLKTRQESPVPDIPVDAGLLAKLSPDVAALVTGLGLTSIAPGLASTLVTLSEGLKVRELPVGEVTNLPVVGEVANTVTGLVSGAGVVGRQVPEVPVVGEVVNKVVNKVTGLASLGGVAARDVADVPVDAGLLAKLSPDVAALVTGLGLTSLAPGLASTLITLSEGLKTRQVEEVVGEVTGAVGGAAGSVPVDAGLLAKLSPSVAALVTGLGLTSLAPGLASTLITLSKGL